MRKLVMLVMLALAAAVAGLSSPPPVQADSCVTYCSPANSCGYICCYRQCCDKICVDLDCAPPPPCDGDN